MPPTLDKAPKGPEERDLEVDAMPARQAVAPTITYDESKFTELLLYVAKLMLDDPSNGSVKLNKVLFYSDFFHYAFYGSPITGATYVKHPRGPAPRGIADLQHRHSDDMELAVFRHGAHPNNILFPKREADLTIFKGTEIAMVNSVFNALKGRSADDVSNMSHALQGWKAAREREEIPYYTIFLYDGPVTEADIEDGQRIAQTLKSELESAGFAVAAS